MTDVRVRNLEIDGFRGYPNRQALSFPQVDGGSLLIVAPNGFGKSSITDAFEFLFSGQGTLERLGVRRAEMNSGRGPLRNTAIPPDKEATVNIGYFDGGQKRIASRTVEIDTPEPMSADLASLAERCIVPFTVRGFSLRAFVEDKSPQTHYVFIAESLGAGRLVELQSRIRNLQSQLRKTAEDRAEHKGVDADLRKLTANAVKKWEAAKAIAWLAARMRAAELQTPDSLDDGDSAIADLIEKSANEAATALRATFEAAKTAVQSLLPLDGVEPMRGPLAQLRAARIALVELIQVTAGGEGRKLVDEALVLLTTQADLSTCPVCETPFEQSPRGSRQAVVDRLKSLQERLKQVAAADTAVSDAQNLLRAQLDLVTGTIVNANNVLGSDGNALINQWGVVHAALQVDDDSGLAHFQEAMLSLGVALDSRIAELAPNAAKKYGPQLTEVRELQRLAKRFDDAEAKRRRCESMIIQVGLARTYIDKTVYEFFQSTVQQISDDTVAFYKKVQEFAPVPVGVKVSLADAEDVDARGIEVLVDFPGLPDAKPRAVLSDSQLHTLALGMRIAIIRRFNKSFPFIVLDDVVTSYDAGYRRQIATVITDDMADVQLLILTHDDQFFRIMKSRLEDFDGARWQARRIVKYDPAMGPQFADARTAETEVDQLLSQGKPAGNAIRQFIEEWMTQTSRGIGARYPMRIPERPFDYGHHELVEAVVEAAEHFGLGDVLAADLSMGRFVGEMKAAVIENEGSHASENPYRSGSGGDDASFWSDFKKFKNLFTCGDPTCGGRRFKYDPSINKACCAKCGKHLDLKPKQTPPPPNEATPN